MIKDCILPLLAVFLLFSCSKKSEPEIKPEKSDFEVMDATDRIMNDDTSVYFRFNVKFLSGGYENIEFHVEGLPDHIYVTKQMYGKIDDDSAFIFWVLSATPETKIGTYPVVLKGVSASGVTKSYKLNLIIERAVRCPHSLLGVYNATDSIYSADNRWIDTNFYYAIVGFSSDHSIMIQKTDSSGWRYSEEGIEAYLECSNQTMQILRQPYLDKDGYTFLNGKYTSGSNATIYIEYSRTDGALVKTIYRKK